MSFTIIEINNEIPLENAITVYLNEADLIFGLFTKIHERISLCRENDPDTPHKFFAAHFKGELREIVMKMGLTNEDYWEDLGLAKETILDQRPEVLLKILLELTESDCYWCVTTGIPISVPKEEQFDSEFGDDSNEGEENPDTGREDSNEEEDI